MSKYIKNLSFNLILKLKEKAFNSKKFKKIYLNALCTKFDFNEGLWIPCKAFSGPLINESFKNSIWYDEQNQIVYLIQRYNDILYRFEYTFKEAENLNFISIFDIPKN